MKVWKIVGTGLAVLLLVGLGLYAWASYAAHRKLSRRYPVHTVGFPSPSTAAEEEKAQERGRHLVQSRYGCAGCHGSGFGGGVMIDNPAMGRILGPNLTTGAGGVTVGYRPADWDRIVRHGLKRNGTPALMPSQDFQKMSDQELSDIVVFFRLGIVSPVAAFAGGRCSSVRSTPAWASRRWWWVSSSGCS